MPTQGLSRTHPSSVPSLGSHEASTGLALLIQAHGVPTYTYLSQMFNTLHTPDSIVAVFSTSEMSPSLFLVEGGFLFSHPWEHFTHSLWLGLLAPTLQRTSCFLLCLRLRYLVEPLGHC